MTKVRTAILNFAYEPLATVYGT